MKHETQAKNTKEKERKEKAGRLIACHPNRYERGDREIIGGRVNCTHSEAKRCRTKMHPLVRDLWKRVVWVGRDYPTGLQHVKDIWKPAVRRVENCPSWYDSNHHAVATGDEEELMRAVHKGRQAVKEMIGVIQLKKYRNLKQRYDSSNTEDALASAMARLEREGQQQRQ